MLLNADILLQENFFYIILLVFFIGYYEVLAAISYSHLSAVTPVFINDVFLKFYSMSVLLLYWYNYFDFTTFLQIYLFGYFVKFVILFIILFRKKYLHFAFSLNGLDLKDMLSFGVYILLGSASLMIVTRLDMMMISSLLNLEQLAFYAVAFYIGNAIRIPARAIGAISTPLIAQAFEKKDFKEIQNLYSKSSINQFIIGGLFFLCVWINIDAIFSLLPENFSQGKWVVLYIGLAQLLSVSAGVNSAIIINSKYYKYDLFTSLFLVVVTITSNYVLIPKYGINGAAMATAFSVFLFNLIRIILIKLKMNLQPFSLKTLYTILILIAIYGVSICLPLTGNLYMDVLWKIFVVVAIFIPLLLSLELSEDINKLVIDVRKRLGL